MWLQIWVLMITVSAQTSDRMDVIKSSPWVAYSTHTKYPSALVFRQVQVAYFKSR